MVTRQVWILGVVGWGRDSRVHLLCSQDRSWWLTETPRDESTLWQVASSCACLNSGVRRGKLQQLWCHHRRWWVQNEEPALSISLCFLHGKLVRWVWGLRGLSVAVGQLDADAYSRYVLTSAVLKTHLVSPSDHESERDAQQFGVEDA